ncbi:hypothetical protein, partial [Salinivibrio sp. AR640]|uniref:hypothetical protein n=1 Tax=Salinivibrio sp. AR640 TaxID=1909437 RepID=UPI0018FE3270
MGDTIVKVVGIVSLPVYTTILTPEEFGRYIIFLTYLSLSSVIMTLNIQASSGRYYYEEYLDKEKFLSSAINIGVIFLSFTSIFLGAVLYFFNIDIDISAECV